MVLDSARRVNQAWLLSGSVQDASDNLETKWTRDRNKVSHAVTKARTLAESIKRTILIGDIHGCFQELQDLLKVLKVRPEDRLICVGDLISKGPQSREVLLWAKDSPNVECILGNHEARFLAHFRGESKLEKPNDALVRRQLGSEYDELMQFISTWPLWIEDPNFLVIHAGLDPRVDALAWQKPEDLLNLRNLKDLNRPWFELYDKKKLIIFGHWAQRGLVQRKNAIGLDSGCVYGGSLSAFVLPEKKIVSVPAHQVYVEKKKNEA